MFASSSDREDVARELPPEQHYILCNKLWGTSKDESVRQRREREGEEPPQEEVNVAEEENSV